MGILPPRHNRRPCNGVPALLIEKFSGDETVLPAPAGGDERAADSPPLRAAPTTDGVRIVLGDRTLHLDREAAAAFRAELEAAITDRREFCHTACEHRADGSYVVERLGASSDGHRKVFESVGTCRRLFDRLPERFAASDVTATGVSGGRRHMLVWHFVEHDAFACELVSRQPLTAEKV